MNQLIQSRAERMSKATLLIRMALKKWRVALCVKSFNRRGDARSVIKRRLLSAKVELFAGGAVAIVAQSSPWFFERVLKSAPNALILAAPAIGVALFIITAAHSFWAVFKLEVSQSEVDHDNQTRERLISKLTEEMERMEISLSAGRGKKLASRARRL